MQDDGSGRQQWTVTAVGNGIYTITMPQGRAGCGQFLQVSACSSEGGDVVNFATGYTNALQTWLLTPVNPSAGRPSSQRDPQQTHSHSALLLPLKDISEKQCTVSDLKATHQKYISSAAPSVNYPLGGKKLDQWNLCKQLVYSLIHLACAG